MRWAFGRGPAERCGEVPRSGGGTAPPLHPSGSDASEPDPDASHRPAAGSWHRGREGGTAPAPGARCPSTTHRGRRRPGDARPAAGRPGIRTRSSVGERSADAPGRGEGPGPAPVGADAVRWPPPAQVAVAVVPRAFAAGPGLVDGARRRPMQRVRPGAWRPADRGVDPPADPRRCDPSESDLRCATPVRAGSWQARSLRQRPRSPWRSAASHPGAPPAREEVPVPSDRGAAGGSGNVYEALRGAPVGRSVLRGVFHVEQGRRPGHPSLIGGRAVSLGLGRTPEGRRRSSCPTRGLVYAGRDGHRCVDPSPVRGDRLFHVEHGRERGRAAQRGSAACNRRSGGPPSRVCRSATAGIGWPGARRAGWGRWAWRGGGRPGPEAQPAVFHVKQG